MPLAPDHAQDVIGVLMLLSAIGAAALVMAIQLAWSRPYRCPSCGDPSCTKDCEQPTDD